MVVDASAVLELVIPHDGPIEQALDALANPSGARSFAAPELMLVEVLNAFRRLARHSSSPAAVPDLLPALPVTTYPHLPLARRVWELRDDLSAYDATYVALAEALSLPLATADRRMARAARRLLGEEGVIEIAR